jgi:citrate synthase
VKNMYEFFEYAINARKNGAKIEEIIISRSRRRGTKPSIPGYGRPLATGDERVLAMERLAKNLGFNVGQILQLAYDMERYLLEHYNESINFAAYTVAFMMDQKLTLLHIQLCLSFMVVAGTAACYLEAHENTPESFLPLRCDDIEYTGPAARPVPDSD